MSDASNNPPESTHCLVVLTDSLYLPGTLKTIESWQRHNITLPVIALSKELEVLDCNELKSASNERILIDTEPYAEISPYKKSRSQRHGETFYKFEAFRDFGYDRNIYLDSDILVLREAPDLVSRTPHQLLAALDTGFRRTRGYKGHLHEINSGVLSIHSSIQGENTISALQEIAKSEPGRSGYNSGDQGIINKWIHRENVDLSVLSSDYNLIKKDYADSSGLDTCRLLHYCNRKPWFEPKAEPSILEKWWRDEST